MCHTVIAVSCTGVLGFLLAKLSFGLGYDMTQLLY